MIQLGRNVTRRQALGRLVGLGALACAAPHLGLGPVRLARAQSPATAQVAFVKTTDRADGIRRALELLRPPSLAGRRILLKPNLNSADPSPGSTHPATLRTLVEALISQAPAGLVIGDRSGMGQTRLVMRETGVDALAQEYGLSTVAFDELGPADWLAVQPADTRWSRGFQVPRLLGQVDAVIQTCNLKTHRFGGHFTLSLKNSVGLAAETVPGLGHNYMTELHSSSSQREMIAEINLAYQPSLVVLDGVDAFLAGGPDRGDQAPTGVILAGSDRVALDAVGVALLRLWGTTPVVSQGPIFEQTQLRRAVELGLGVGSPSQIELLADDQPSQSYAADVRALLDAA